MVSERAREFYFLAEQIKIEPKRALSKTLQEPIDQEQESSHSASFRVLAVNLEEGSCSYFVARVGRSLAHPDNFFWCNAIQPVKVGDLVSGHLLDGITPTLVIN